MFEKLKRKRDWVGRKVELLRDIENKGGGVFQKGTVMLVKKNFGGLELARLEFCQKCLCRGWVYINRVSETSVKLLPDGV